jgi:hypothetical protein
LPDLQVVLFIDAVVGGHDERQLGQRHVAELDGEHLLGNGGARRQQRAGGNKKGNG